MKSTYTLPQFIFMKKYKKLIYTIILILISLAIILPVYFFVIKKSNSSQSPSNELSTIPITGSTITMIPNQLGLCYVPTYNGVKQSKRFIIIDSFLNTTFPTLADNGDTIPNGIQYKWSYDKTNPLNLTRTISNVNKKYTDDELANLGQTSTPTSYLVNQIIPIYDNTNPKYSIGTVDLDPFILTTYSQCN